MALGLKILIQQDITGGSIWLTDKTGEYDAANNDTGWGTPNPDLADRALVMSVVRNALAGKEKVTPISFDAFHNNTALNTDETVFEFRYLMDGWHSITFFELPVSADDINILGGGTLSNLDYYYSSARTEVNQLDSAEPAGYKVVEDFEEMVGNLDIVQLTCEEIFYNKLAIKANDLYKVYRDARDNKGADSRDAKQALSELLDIREDIRGADYAFRSGLTTEAQDIIETAITRYDIT